MPAPPLCPDLGRDVPFSSLSSETHSETLRHTPTGALFCGSLYDLFSTLMVSLRLRTHKRAFRSYPFSFTPDEALVNLASLQLCRSERRPSETNPDRTVVVTTTKVFTLLHSVGLQLLQSFVSAHLIRSAWDSLSPVQEGRGVYVLTPKGIAVVQRFVSENGTGADHLAEVVDAFQSKKVDLIYISRSAEDDSLCPGHGELVALFRHFAGPKPNTRGSLLSTPPDPRKGVYAQDVVTYVSEGQVIRYEHCFSGSDAVVWLLDHTTANSVVEACQVCAQLCQMDMMHMCLDAREDSHGEHVIQTAHTSGPCLTTTAFIYHPRVLYQTAKKGRQQTGLILNARQRDESYNKRLQQILDDPAQLDVFRSFLNSQLAVENLSLWLDVEHLRRRYHTSSSATAAGAASLNGADSSSHSWRWFRSKRSPGSKIPEEPDTVSLSSEIDVANQVQLHHQQLSAEALEIYWRYVPVDAPREINVAWTLRQKAMQLIESLPTKAVSQRSPAAHSNLAGSPPQLSRQTSIRLRRRASATVPRTAPGALPPPSTPTIVPSLGPNQLCTLVNILVDIQEAARTLMATDLIPRFIDSGMMRVSNESYSVNSPNLSQTSS